HLGLLGEMAQAFSAVIALVTAFVASPLMAWGTKGRYYLARSGPSTSSGRTEAAVVSQRCTVCERSYEPEDMAYCPAYLGHICSLCCTLDARCHDMCKPQASWSAQWRAAARAVLPQAAWRKLDTELGRYLLLMGAIVPVLAMLFHLVYRHELARLGTPAGVAAQSALAFGFMKVFAVLAIVAAIVTWWLVL